MSQSYVESELGNITDIKFNDQLSKSLISVEDFSDVIQGEINEYIIRKHLREIMKLYLKSVSEVRKITVTDKAKFGFQMETIGLNIGYTTENQSSSKYPDGNTVVLSVVMVVCLALVLRNLK